MAFIQSADQQALILNLLRARGERGATCAEVQLLMNEAEAARVAWVGFQAAIRGQINVDVRDGEVVWMLPDRDA